MVVPKDFVDSAKTMIGEFEVGNRNAVSRMYYGVYHTGLQFAFNGLGYTYTMGSSVHKQLIEFLNTKTVRT